MKLCMFFIPFILVYSCKENNVNKTEVSNKPEFVSTDLSQELHSTLVKYQRLYPKDDKEDLSIYEAFFYKSDSDTFLTLRRSAEGVSPNKNEILLGIYRDSTLFPTVIRDPKEWYGKNFVKKAIYESIRLNEFKPLPGKNYSESYPPIHRFKVTGNKLILNRR